MSRVTPETLQVLLMSTFTPLENHGYGSHRATTNIFSNPLTDLVTSPRSGRTRGARTPSGAQNAVPGGPAPLGPVLLSRPPPPAAGPPPGPRAGGRTPPPGAAGSRAGTAASPAPPTRVPAGGGGPRAAPPRRTPARGSPPTGGRRRSPGTAAGDADAPSSLGFEGERDREAERERETERERDERDGRYMYILEKKKK